MTGQRHRHLLENLEAQAVGQVNVEKQHVGRGPGLQQLHGLGHRFGRADDFQGFGLAGQHVGQAAGGQGLVFNDKRAEESQWVNPSPKWVMLSE